MMLLMVKKRAPIKSRKLLTGEALYQKLMEDEFASITLNESRLIQEDWKQVNAQEEALLRMIIVTAPALQEPDMVKDSEIQRERMLLGDLYHRSGIEGSLVDGLKRSELFVERIQSAVERINGKPDITKGRH